MKTNNHSKVAYILDGLTSFILPENAIRFINSFIVTENIYLSATREIVTKLENLNDEFIHTKDRNPIHQIKARVKTPKSIMDKLTRLGCELVLNQQGKISPTLPASELYVLILMIFI